MRIISYSLAVVGVVAAGALLALSFTPKDTSFLSLQDTDSIFARYVAREGKSYGTKEEYEFRKDQYFRNMAAYNDALEVGATFTLGENKFSDWTPQEYRRLLGYKKVEITEDESEVLQAVEGLEAPTSVDWRSSGAVTPVKDQASCGSCWAFSTTGALEGAHFVATKKLVSLSEQQFVDCSKKNAGCNGGDMYAAMVYAKTNPVELESAYPYTGRDGTCKFDKTKGVVTATSAARVQANSVAALKAAIAISPVSVSIEADTRVFQGYTGGILNSAKCGTNLDHGVLAVGYGTENGQDFYIVKNSWGPTWGEKGYIRIAAVNGAGICGIQLDSAQAKTN